MIMMNNSNLMALVLCEKDTHMRNDVEVKFRSTRTGVMASFRANLGINRFGTPEYAHITTIATHRIQSAESVIKALRNDSRLYD